MVLFAVDTIPNILFNKQWWIDVTCHHTPYPAQGWKLSALLEL